VGEAFSPEDRHEWGCERVDALIERFQRAFTADGIAEKHGDKIDHLVMPEAATSKTHLLFNGSERALAL